MDGLRCILLVEYYVMCVNVNTAGFVFSSSLTFDLSTLSSCALCPFVISDQSHQESKSD